MAGARKTIKKFYQLIDTSMVGIFYPRITGVNVISVGHHCIIAYSIASCLQHWIKEKMIEKNKAIRLAAARKTIKELEKKVED